MKDVIIEAGQRLGGYFRGELGGRATPTNIKKLCAVSTDILPGDRYEAVRNMLSFGSRYGLVATLTDGDKNGRQGCGKCTRLQIFSSHIISYANQCLHFTLLLFPCCGDKYAAKFNTGWRFYP